MEWTDEEEKADSKLICSVLYYPRLEIRLNQRRVLKDGKEVHLSRYEYGVLSFMAQHPGTLFTKEEICARYEILLEDYVKSLCTETIAITAPTPIIIPSIVSNERILFAHKADIAICTVSLNNIHYYPLACGT